VRHGDLRLCMRGTRQTACQVCSADRPGNRMRCLLFPLTAETELTAAAPLAGRLSDSETDLRSCAELIRLYQLALLRG